MWELNNQGKWQENQDIRFYIQICSLPCFNNRANLNDVT